MARMAKTKRPAHRRGERDAKTTRGPAAAVIILLGTKTLELNRPQALGANQLLIVYRHNRPQVRPALQLLPKHMSGEGAITQKQEKNGNYSSPSEAKRPRPQNRPDPRTIGPGIGCF